MKNILGISTCFFIFSSVSATADDGRIGGGKLLVDDVTTLTTDLDGDGHGETFEVSDNGESLTTLTIKRLGKPMIVARDIAWSLELASLKLAPNGSVQLVSSHIGVGRTPHEQTLTIAYRNGAYRVVGMTRGEWDRHDPDKNSVGCDINFVTGRSASGQRFPPGRWARPITAWKWDQTLPTGCFIP